MSLKSPKPIEEGKKIKCPKCGVVFGVTAAKRRTSGISASAPQGKRPSGGEFNFEDPPEPTAKKRPKRVKLTNGFIVWGVCFIVTALFTLPPYIAFRIMGKGLMALGKEFGEQDLTNVPADFTMSTDDYDKDAQDPTKRDKYVGKVFELKGVVKSYNRDILTGTPAISLKAGAMGEIRCRTIDKEPWATVSPGQEVTIKARSNRLSYPSLIDCIFVQKGDNPAIVITADKLAEEYGAAAEPTNEKYKDKYLIVTGEVTDQKQELGPTQATLTVKGNDKVNIKITIDSHKGGLNALGADPNKPQDLQPPNMVGKEIKFIGRYGAQLSDKEITLSDVELITKKE
jgi:hypothetical protein